MKLLLTLLLFVSACSNVVAVPSNEYQKIKSAIDHQTEVVDRINQRQIVSEKALAITLRHMKDVNENLKTMNRQAAGQCNPKNTTTTTTTIVDPPQLER